ncbi:MAG: HD domain-containing protein [Clostridia bacterium]|nr:HD domain-containing protein [Clostridia bacterium]
MHIQIPDAAARAIGILEQQGYEGYLVGGCVRDAVRGVQPHDWDITTSALPQETMAAFSGFRIIETGLKHGTVTVLMEGEPLEITTFRQDGDYADHRHPDGVTFVRDLRADLIRRDFTMNAMAYCPRTGLVDPFGGREDIEKGILRAVGDPDCRFDEDALRILRALRFASRFGYRIEEHTRAAMSRKAHLLVHVSSERILSELRQMLVGAHVLEVLLSCPDILAVPLPEIKGTVGFAQHNRHHIHDVWGHTAHAVAAAPADPILRLTMLLHDLGKPLCYSEDGKGEGHFYGHAARSAELADRILRRLKCDTFTREEVCRLVAHHDDTLHADARTARRLLSRHGYERACRLLEVRRADLAAHAPEFHGELDALDALRRLLDDLLAQEGRLTLKALAVKGTDLMELGYAGPAVGKALGALLDAVVDGDCENEKAALLAYVKNL